MTTETAALPTDLKVAFCCYCQTNRTRAEMRPLHTPSGIKINRCIECIDRTKSPAAEGRANAR